MKANRHATIGKGYLDQVRAIYPHASADVTYTVVLVDRSPSLGRTRFYLDDPREEGRRICLYRRQICMVPSCAYCDQEGHTRWTATAKNCPVVKQDIEDRRAKKKAAKTAEATA